jgi:hypothetical protein
MSLNSIGHGPRCTTRIFRVLVVRHWSAPAALIDADVDLGSVEPTIFIHEVKREAGLLIHTGAPPQRSSFDVIRLLSFEIICLLESGITGARPCL